MKTPAGRRVVRYVPKKIEKITQGEAQRVCSRAFRAGDIVWNCKQCQMDSTCVLCQQCFRDSNHEGHDVYFYHVMTDAGGCCDCGDEGAWNEKGFCSRHGVNNVTTQDPDPRKWLPEEMVVSTDVAIKGVIGAISRLAKCGRAELVLEPIPEALADESVLQTEGFRNDVKRFLEYIQYSSTWKLHSREAREDMGIPILLSNWVEKVKRCVGAGQPLMLEVKGFVLSEITLQNIGQWCKMVSDLRSSQFFKVVMRNTSALRISFYTQQLATWLLAKLCRDSDSFTRFTAHALTEQKRKLLGSVSNAELMANGRVGYSLLPLKSLIVQDLQLPDSCSKSLRNLYIRLLVDSLFKRRFAIAFAEKYRASCRARVNCLPILEVSDVDSIFGLSVQFLNRPNHVLLLVQEHDFLFSILESLYETVKHCECPSVESPGQVELDLLSTVMTHRKTKCVVTDFTYVLNTRGMSKYLLTSDPRYLNIWFDLLELLYGMHMQRRIVEPDTPERDERWIPAFNLSLSLLSLYSDFLRYLNFGDLISLTSVEELSMLNPSNVRLLTRHEENHTVMCSKLLALCANRVSKTLQSRVPVGMNIVMVDTKLGRHPYVPYNIVSAKVTFHCLLQRFFALIHSLCVASSLDADNYVPLSFGGTQAFWLALMRHPLNAIILFSQSTAGMWLRNEDLSSQAMNYQSLPFLSGMFMDIRVLQMAALNIPSEVFINYIVHAFGVVKYFGLEQASSTSAENDKERAKISDEQYGKLSESMMEMLCILVTELPQPTPFAYKQKFDTDDANDPRIVEQSNKFLRREIVHCLAIKRCTFSMISDTCTHLRQLGVQINSTNLRNVLKTVSQEIVRADGMGPIQYDLKPEAWEEFDPLFHRLARNEKDQARERWVQHRISKPIPKACFPGDTKPKSMATRNAPLPATGWHSNIHPAFVMLRERLLTCGSLFQLFDHALQKVCSENSDQSRAISHSVLFLGNTLHLMTLQLHYIKSRGTPETVYYSENFVVTEYAWKRTVESKEELQQRTVTSVEWYVNKMLEVREGMSANILDWLLVLWYSEPRIDETNRESVRWILGSLCKMDARCQTIMKRAYKSRKSSLQAQREKMSRKRKAQRHAMETMRQSQEQALRAFANEMEMDDAPSVDEGETGAVMASVEIRQRGSINENDPKKTKMSSSKAGSVNRSDQLGASDELEENTAKEPIPDNDTNGLESVTTDTGLQPDLFKEDGYTVNSWMKLSTRERQSWRGPECVSCHERHGLDEGPTCFIGFRQCNDVLIRKPEETTDRGWCVYWMAEEGQNYVIQLCGHAIHAKCLERYRSSILPMSVTESDKCEFLCPFCKTLSNFEIPCVPPSLVYLPNATEELCGDSTGTQHTMTELLDECVEQLSFGATERGSFASADESSLENDTEQEMVDFASKQLEPLTDSLKSIMVLRNPKLRHHVDTQRIFHSEEGRRRERATMVLLDRTERNQANAWTENRISILASVALTFIAERVQTCFSNPDAPSISTKSLNTLRRTFEACRAFLLLEGGNARKHLLNAEMKNQFSDKRSVSFHCVLHRSPELLVVILALGEFSKKQLYGVIRAMYILKITQTLLEYSIDDVESNEGMPSGTVIDQPTLDMFDGAFDLRDSLLDKFEKLEMQRRNAVQTGFQPSEDRRLWPIIESVRGYVHIAQMALRASSRVMSPEPLKLVSMSEMGQFMKNELDLPSPKEILGHHQTMKVVLEWIDQSLVCMPEWIPRSLTNLIASSTMCSHKTPYFNMENADTSERSNGLDLRPLSIRPLVRLRYSYTEQYAEVHKGLCQDCKEPAHDKAICLICGEVLLAGKNHPGMNVARNVVKGECTKHTEDYHNGIGMVLLFRRSSSVLLINRSCSSYWGSLYVDQNGDDQQVFPSLPMFLDKQRFNRIEKLWAENNIPNQVSSLRNQASVVIRRNYY
mmetsp:Transcript_30818/g.49388  ORF Transcript_30818/g.49388 Transcript_30818/m.49388 type:complete len:1932 (-) Transcript_30818:165-5960(-)